MKSLSALTGGPSLELSRLVCRSALGFHNSHRLTELCRQDALACFDQQHGEGLQGLFAYQLSTQAPDLAKAEVLGKFQIEFGLGARMLAQLHEVDQAFHKSGLEAVAFKGCSFHPEVYPVLGTRPVSDLDLWVQARHFPEAERVLVSRGYRRVPGIGSNYLRDGGAIDLHRNPLNQLAPVFPLAQSWWEARQPLGAFQAIRRLPNEEALIATALHGLKHSFRRLLWLLDVALLGRLACPIRTAQLARQLGCQRMLSLCDALVLGLLLEQAPYPMDWNTWELRLLATVPSRTAPESAGMLLPLFSDASWWRKCWYGLSAAYAGGSCGGSRIGRLWEIFLKLRAWAA